MTQEKGSLVGAVFLASVLFACFACVLHEYGHYLAYQMYGYPATLHYMGTSSSSKPDPFQAGVISIAGIAVTLAVSLVCLLLMYMTRSSLFLSLGSIMAGRNIAGLPFLLLGITTPHDENAFTIFWGLPLPSGTVYITILIFDLVVIAGLVKFAEKQNRVALGAATILGGSVGVALWLLLLGPLLLP